MIKLLDASVRLHLQAHPAREFVKEHFGGNAGKTECCPVAASETWLLPSAADEWRGIALSNDWNVLLAQPPVRFKEQ